MSEPCFTPAEVAEVERGIELISRTGALQLTKAGDIAKRFGRAPLSAVEMFGLLSAVVPHDPEIETISTAGEVRVLLLFNDLSRLTVGCQNGVVRIR